MIAPHDECQEFTDLFYLAFCIYREARGELPDARAAVGHSILNRVHRPSWWGRTVDEVVTKKWQFSSLTDPNDPQLARAWPRGSERAWRECWELARALMSGAIPNEVPGADSYHDLSIAAPKWTASARFCGQIGRLRFFDVDHDWEVP